MSQHDRQVINICNPTLLPTVLESDRHKLSGILAPNVYEYSSILEKITNVTPNYDASYPGIGRRIGNTELFDGCIGKMQAGEADFIPAPVNYGMDIVNVSQGFISFDEKVSYMGAFARPNATNPADFARSIFAFEWSTYLLIVVYLIMFYICFAFRRKIMIKVVTAMILDLRKCRGKPILTLSPAVEEKLCHVYFNRIGFWDVIRHFIHTNCIEPRSICLTVLVTFLTLYSMVIFAYFTSRLNTDLFIPEKAVMFENYDEIMKAGVKPLFMKGMTNYEDLKYAANGTKAKQFWDWAVAKFGEDKLFVEAKLSNLGHYSIDGMKAEILLFAGEIITKTLKTTVCEIIGRPLGRLMYLLSYISNKTKNFDWFKFEDSQAYIRQDPSAKSVIKAALFSDKFLQNPSHHRMVRTFFSRVFEHGHIVGSTRKLETTNLYDLQPGLRSLIGPPVIQKWEIKNICKAKNIPVHKPAEIDHVRLANMKYSLISCSVVLSISILVFIHERLSNRKRKVTPKVDHKR